MLAKRGLLGLLLVFLFALGVMGYRLFTPSATSSGQQEAPLALLATPRPLALQLEDDQRATFSQRQLQGVWSLVYFGYTSCPDACPTALAKLRLVYSQLQKAQPEAPVQVIFVAVDPERDRSHLAEYVDYFHPDFVGVTGSHAMLEATAQQMGAVFHIPESREENYPVDHSGRISVINPQGELHGWLMSPLQPAAIHAALQHLLSLSL